MFQLLSVTAWILFTHHQSYGITVRYGQRHRLRHQPIKAGYELRNLHESYCERGSCYPATGNLLIGRENQLYASSTCGLYGQQRYCIVSHLDKDRKKCFWCDSRPTSKPNPQYNHNISNIVSRLYPGTRQPSWWQSENGKENVYIQLDMEAEFHFTHLIMTFKTFRPAAMLIERSYDKKQTWQVYRYFAYNCTESFPGIREEQSHTLTDVVCESRYSSLSPASNGEVIYRVLPPTLPIDNPYSEQVQNLLKLTNLRINFTKLHTLGDNLLDRREEIQEKYYYAITDMVVRGSCSCYGHANRCLPLNGIAPKADMVHGRCECTHNTKGRNCEECEDFFNDLPWRPAIGKQTNACKRCNCNNHAINCHYDAALYESTGQVSGGVCDDCQHNTMGPNCEMCKPYFYRDPEKDIQDPEVCRLCDCDPHGSLDGGICDSITDPADNSLAGSCRCKENVEGRRCDSCKNGFWNFSDVNPAGCQECTCNAFGTINYLGCNVNTGECTCKRYVTGRDCNQCLREYWGLSGKKDGCQSCDCDPGGSYDNFCDVITGQCRCRDHMTGRTCDTPRQQYFTASLDFLLYEAEAATTTGQVIIREPYRDGRENSWTGTGFIKMFERDQLEVTVDKIRTSMDYDVVIRYESTNSGSWEDIVLTIIRSEPVDANGTCAGAKPEDDTKHVILPSNGRSVTTYPASCLEAGKHYRILLEFKRSSFEKDSPTASVLIDSVVLVPKIVRIPWFNNSIRSEYEWFNCGRYMFYGKREEIPEACKKYHASIAAYVFDGAYFCHCDPTGSTSKICDPNGGSCACKANVEGRRCERCKMGTYGFGPEGCKACDCNSVGSMDNICNVTTGQCKCRANTYGRECDQCRTGYWHFPNCEICNCNGHADTCEARTGVCINCKGNTQGSHCDYCVEGYYGDPRLNVGIPCRPCPCPGPLSSNHSFADRCSLDPVTKDVICECQEGYAGAKCDVCSDNYYGNPEVPGGSCVSCDCSDKVDLLQPGNCDPHTGKCLRCLYETTGDHCEVCRPGFYRTSDDQLCRECVCQLLGSDRTAGPCDPTSGQCHCLPNVTGLECDKCISNHWKIASGVGCEPCECDSHGSLSPQCNEFDGHCTCKSSFGGRRCNECLPQYFGDPKVKCHKCECHARGAETNQCDMRTGACKCSKGVGGYKCDRCKRGFIGQVPYCEECEECFYNWDRVLQGIKNNTFDIIERAGDINIVGATGAYTKEFDDMQAQLDDIEELIYGTNDVDVKVIEDKLQNLRRQIYEIEHDQLGALDDNIDNVKNDMFLVDRNVNNLNQSIVNLREKIHKFRNNGTKLQEANVQGALSLIGRAKEKADRAALKAEHSEDDIKYAKNQCRATETFINMTEKQYQRQSEDNTHNLKSIQEQLETLNKQIPELNSLVCDGAGDPCDQICGGAGCQSCGNSFSCENGAKQLAENAINFANSTEGLLRNKETAANDFVRNVSHIDTNETYTVAFKTFKAITEELNKSNGSLEVANKTMKEIREYLGQNNTKPEDIKKLAEEVLRKNVHKTPEDVMKMAENIKNAIDRLTNTDLITSATKNDLLKVEQLKEDAAYAKTNAGKLLNQSEDVGKTLNKTQQAQKNAQEAINKAWDDDNTVIAFLNKIDNETNAAADTSAEIKEDIVYLKDTVNDLQKNITVNSQFAKRIIKESGNILMNAQKTQADSQDLQEKYLTAKNELEKNLKQVKSTKERSEDLFTKALNLVEKIKKTQEDVQRLEESTQGRLLYNLEENIKALIYRMNIYNKKLEDKSQYYKTCII